MKIALVVHANPFAALDHVGRAQCAVYHPGTSIVVGGAFDHEAHEASKAESVSGEGKHRFTFTKDPVDIVCDSIATFAYFRNRILEGSLIAGNEATAKKCGVLIDKDHPFVPPADALRAAKASAIKAFKDAYGESAEPECAKEPAAKAEPAAAEPAAATVKSTKSAAQPAAKE